MSRLAKIVLLIFAAATSVSCWAQTSADGVANPAVTSDAKFLSGGVTISGTVEIPPNIWAAAVLVQGSGRAERMTGFARWLASQGVASLTYDKRGVGKSGGVYAGPEVGTNNVTPANLNLLAGDAAAAFRELARRIPNHRVPIGLIGFSQGGWIVPLAAIRTSAAKFMILWSGPVVTTREQLRFQFFTDGKADFWEHHSEADVREHVRSDADRFQFIDTDPAKALRKLSIPGFWLFGGRDLNVPVSLSIERLRALAATGKPFKYKLFPELGHQLSETDAMPEIIEWLKKTSDISAGTEDFAK
jgi:pimeloyl-ACP methyl ester carboxylesterase